MEMEFRGAIPGCAAACPHACVLSSLEMLLESGRRFVCERGDLLRPDLWDRCGGKEVAEEVAEMGSLHGWLRPQ